MKAQIHATLGPASWQEQVLEGLLKSGIYALRINMSHMEHEKLCTLFNRIRALAPHVELFADIRGRKLRIGPLPGGGVTLVEGEMFTLIPMKGEEMGTERSASVNYPGMAQVLRPGDYIILDDGAIRFNVEKIEKYQLICRVVRGGKLTDRCGVNTPKRQLSLPALTSKDYTDLDLLSTMPLDGVYLSFAETARDIMLLRDAMKQRNMHQPIMAKIETQVAIDNLHDLIASSDGICLARGDLGVEIPMQELPYMQRNIIASAKEAGKPFILAGEVLYSLLKRHEPFRAELMDIITAIEQGAAGFILSDETAIGVDPLNAVTVLKILIEEAERRKYY
jgi:pyruvate kinase